MNKIGKVRWEGCHVNAQATPDLEVLIEPVGEVGCGVLGRLGVGKGNLHGIEVLVGPRHGQVNRAALAYEMPHLHDQYAALCGGYHRKGEEIYSSFGGQGKGTSVSVH